MVGGACALVPPRRRWGRPTYLDLPQHSHWHGITYVRHWESVLLSQAPLRANRIPGLPPSLSFTRTCQGLPGLGSRVFSNQGSRHLPVSGLKLLHPSLGPPRTSHLLSFSALSGPLVSRACSRLLHKPSEARSLAVENVVLFRLQQHLAKHDTLKANLWRDHLCFSAMSLQSLNPKPQTLNLVGLLVRRWVSLAQPGSAQLAPSFSFGNLELRI